MVSNSKKGVLVKICMICHKTVPQGCGGIQLVVEELATRRERKSDSTFREKKDGLWWFLRRWND